MNIVNEKEPYSNAIGDLYADVVQKLYCCGHFHWMTVARKASWCSSTSTTRPFPHEHCVHPV